jgi:hypothetical protein
MARERRNQQSLALRKRVFEEVGSNQQSQILLRGQIYNSLALFGFLGLGKRRFGETMAWSNFSRIERSEVRL